MAAPIFDYINSISYGKDLSLTTRDGFDKEYNPYVVNRAFSYFHDSVLAANMMNERPHLDKRLQYRFLLSTLVTRKRFSEWFKNTTSDEDAEVVAEYYECSLKHARSITPLHSAEQLLLMRTRLDTGGASTRGTRNAKS